LQIPKNKQNLFLKALSSKGTGIVSMGAITAAVSTLGTASTGTAIITLSGAAKASATLAAIGSIVGGGYAAGGVVLALTGVAGGYAFRNLLGRLWFGKERKPSDLSVDEFRIQILCSSLSNVIKRYVDQNNEERKKTSIKDILLFLQSGINPLFTLVKNTEDDLKKNMSYGSKSKFDSVLKDLKKTTTRLNQNWLMKTPVDNITNNFKSYFKYKNFKSLHLNTTYSASVCFTVFLYKILSNTENSLADHEFIILEAFRRSAKRFKNASVEDIREYITNLEPNEITGWFSNAKGIYHELLWAEKENLDGDSLTARLFDSTNHPGSDIEFILDGEVINEVQFKAVADPESIVRHFERYPDIEVYATSEVANQVKSIFDNVTDSEFSLEEIDGQMKAFMFPDNVDMIPDAEAGAAIGIVVAALKNRKGSKSFGKKVKDSLEYGIIGSSTAIVLEYILFS
jgi:hypothetical protein